MAGTNPVAQEASGLPTALQNDAQTPGTSQNGYPTQRTEPQADSARSTMTPEEKRWILYDVGNSAFVLLSTAIIPIYANSLLKQAGESNIVSTWGYAQTAAALVIALLMPLLGSIADIQGMKIKFFLGFCGTGMLACCALALPLSWLPFLILCIISSIGLNGSLTFYDSMLVDVTSDERMDRVSSHGFAWGYVGSTVPFILCIALIFVGPQMFGISTAECTRIAFIVTALWWAAFTVPLVRSYRQRHFRATASQMGNSIRHSFGELRTTLMRIAHNKSLLLFMLAFFLYIDAVNTIIAMSTSYGTQLGIDSTQMVMALLATQFVAFPSAIIYGRCSGRFGTKRMIVIAVIAYMAIVFFAAFLLRTATAFWILAIAVGLFQGGIQALSRSYYGRLIPKNRANEYFGFFDIFGKFASVLGTFLVAVITSITGNPSLGVLSIGILLVGALILLGFQNDPTASNTTPATM
jgi:UMF1 family MFS transporter